MNEHPIPLITPMVQATLEGRKTKTRRIFKDHARLASDVSKIDLKQWLIDYPDLIKSYSPYGQIGDLLWVRETFVWEGTTSYNDIFKLGQFYYKADTEKFGPTKWKSSRFMPKIAARIWLEITDLTIERLQDISPEDAENEGIEKYFNSLFQEYRYKDYANVTSEWRLATSSFQSLWASIHGVNNWDLNPWVWVITFKVLSTTGRPTTF